MATKSYIIIYLVFLYTVSCYGETSTCRRYPLEDASHTLTVDCSKSRLTKLPKHIFSDNIIALDLSMNTFPVLARSDFKELVHLLRLNISMNGIRILSEGTFDGLLELEELDMKNNPVINTGLPRGIFDYLPRLRRLQISGYVTDDSKLSSYGTLHNLREIVITPDAFRMPNGLAKLEKIKVIYFVFCSNFNNLTQSMLESFSKTNIEELAIFRCSVKTIENGAFNGFASLKTLNFAGNRDLDVNYVIDALSSSRDVAISNLILDLISWNSSKLVSRERFHCRKAWRHIVNLSIRGNKIQSLPAQFLINCLTNLKRISLGFNPFFRQNLTLSILYNSFRHIVYVDFSYMIYTNISPLKYFIGYHNKYNWIKQNKFYFTLPMNTSNGGGEVRNQTKYQQFEDDNCTGISFPSNIKFLRMDHAVCTLTSYLEQNCYKLYNSLKYLDISYPYGMKVNIKYQPVIFGFLKLEIAKLAGLHLYYVNWATFQHSPSLRILNLDRNSFGLGPLNPFPRIPKLQELIFSANSVSAFPSNMFVKLTSLRRLIISRNRLTSFNINLPNALEYLDISGNLLASFDNGAMAKLGQMPSFVIHVDHNPLQCDCNQIEFLYWYQHTRIHIMNKELITCQHHVGSRAIVDTDVDSLKLSCRPTTNKLVTYGVSVGLAIFFISVGFVIYRCRHLLRWRCWQLGDRIRSRRKDDLLLPELNITHHSYVNYDTEDDISNEFVDGVLKPGVSTRLKLITKDDWLLNSTPIDETVRCIKEANTTIWIVTKAYFNRSICRYGAIFSRNHLGPSNILCVILSTEFDSYRTMSEVKQLITKKHTGVNIVEYSDNEYEKRLFWAKLDRFIADSVPGGEYPDPLVTGGD